MRAKRAPKSTRKRQSGWHKDPRLSMGEFSFRPPVQPAVPTRWERMLGELGVTEAQALALLGDAGLPGPAIRIRQWVRKHCRRVFVPEPVLAALGLGERDLLSVDREACAERGRAAWAARVNRQGSAGVGE